MSDLKNDAPEAIPTASSTHRMCPLFTAAAMAKGSEDAVACQGPACMWYMPVRDHKGQELPGQCAPFQGAMGLSVLNLSLRAAAKLDNPFKKGH